MGGWRGSHRADVVMGVVLGAPAGSVSAAGSVPTRCLDQAQCPVAVVRSSRQRRPRPGPAGRDDVPRLIGQT